MESVKFIEQSIRTASVPDPEQAISEIDELYYTEGGFTPAEIDQSVLSFFEDLIGVIEGYESSLEEEQHINMEIVHANVSGVEKEGYRSVVDNNQTDSITLRFFSAGPANVEMRRRIYGLIPKDCAESDPIRFLYENKDQSEVQDELEVKASEIIPHKTEAAEMKLDIWIERIMGRALDELRKNTLKKLRQAGYE